MKKKVAPKRGRPADPRRRQENTRAILYAALDAFTDKGFSAARISDIAKRAGIAKGTVYLYFPSKEALFEGLLTDLIDDPFADTEPLRAEERIGDYVRRVLAPVYTDFERTPRGRVMRLVFAEGSRFPALANGYHRLVITPALRRIESLAELAVQRGEVPYDTLQRYPMLMFAPGLFIVTWNALFTEARPVDIAVMMEAYLTLLFGPPTPA